MPNSIEEKARELLAAEYERCVGEGPYPTYARLARKGFGSFTLCSIRAIVAALSPNMDHAVGGVDPDLGAIESGHVCKHEVRWPHACQPCDEASWQNSRSERSIVPPPVNQDAVREALESAEKLIDDMSRFVGQMNLRDYGLFNEAPIKIRKVLRALATPPLDNTGLDAATVERCAQVAEEFFPGGYLWDRDVDACDASRVIATAIRVLASGDRS